MYIQRVILENIRSFRRADISFDLSAETPPWTMFTGDNASGKTTLLKAIALGLCDLSSAAGLLRESDAGFVRHGESNARIRIDLVSSTESHLGQNPERKSIRIITHIDDLPNSGLERVKSQRTTPPSVQFPWDDIFACGYGAGRGTSGTGDFADYAVINSVYSLFNYNEGLQNPELTIRRLQAKGKHQEVVQVISSILNIDEVAIAGGDDSGAGITLSGPWGYAMPLRDLADGYKSTFLWITDFIGWALTHQPWIQSLKEIVGIVLFDELEQHLHPQWQRTIVGSLREQFPKVQFITTTHSPLVARSTGEFYGALNQDKLHHLQLFPSNETVVTPALEPMRGWGSDQVLASEAFDWLVNADPDVAYVLKTASELEAKGPRRTVAEEALLESLKEPLANILLQEGETLIERSIESGRYDQITEDIRALRNDLNL